MKRFSAFFLFAMLMTACRFFEAKIPDENELLEEELQKINWTEVDTYPSALPCDSLTDREEQKYCLYRFLVENIEKRLVFDSIKIFLPEIDTLSIKVIVAPDSTLQFQIHTDSTWANTRSIDSLLRMRLSDFPIIEPAIKQGIKVKSELLIKVSMPSKNHN